MKKQLLNYWYLNGVSSSPVIPDAANFLRTTISVADGSANTFIYEPEGLNIVPDGGWPVVIFFGGDGTSNNTTTVVTAQAMSTGDNLTYTHSPSLFGFRMMCSSVRIKSNGVEVARGYPGGTITGTGITGTITNFNTAVPGDSTTPTVSVTFGSSQSGNTITYDYVYSTVFIEGPMRYLNLGDTYDDKAIIICIQNIGNTNDYNRDYWDNTVTYAWNNYDINPNRIYGWGISRGGRQLVDQFAEGANTSVLKSRYQFWIKRDDGTIVTSDPSNETTHATSGLAALVCGTTSYGGTFTAANYTDIGMAIVHGTSDGTLTNTTYSFAATMASNNEPPYILNISGGFHNYEVWDTQCYNRLYRTDATGTALWDLADFTFKYSKNALECATLHVEQAEKRRYATEKDIIDYRHALRKVEALGASAEKTALQTRLATLKTSIDNGGTRWVFNPHNTGLGESGNYVNLASSAGGSGVTNVVDFDGNTTTVDLTLTTSPGGGLSTITSTRRSYTGGFSKTANASGIVLTGFPLGLYTWGGLPTGTYTVRLYHNEGVGSYATDPRMRVTINGVTKSAYSAINTLLGYIEFTGLSQAQIATMECSYDTSANTTLTIIELYKNP